MNPEAEFDAYLSRRMQSVPLPDADFTLALSARMTRHRHRHHAAWIAAVGLATVVIAVVLPLLPDWALPLALLTPQHIAAVLLMATLCGLAWIGAESKAPKSRGGRPFVPTAFG